MAAGILYIILSGAVRLRGTGFITRLLPPVVIGPVIMVIGLGLAPVAVHMASGRTGDGAQQLVPYDTAIWIAMISLAVTVIMAVWSSGIFRLIPIMFGIIVGYILSAFAGHRGPVTHHQRALVRHPQLCGAGVQLGSHPVHDSRGHRTGH